MVGIKYENLSDLNGQAMAWCNVEEVFACMDADGGEDLGINASNEAYLEYHGTDREYYPLSNFPADSMEILGQRQDMGQDKKEEMGMSLC